ncbi:MAG: DUF1559 domain-containing protein [Planctomycetota bacterium]
MTSSSQMIRGLTLIELLVALTIIGVLVGILLPAIQSARASARLTACRNNTRQCVLALQNFYASREHFPHLGFEDDRCFGGTVQLQIISFLNQPVSVGQIETLGDGCVDLCRFGRVPDPVPTPVSVFNCPDDEVSITKQVFFQRLGVDYSWAQAGISYMANVGTAEDDFVRVANKTDGMFYGGSQTSLRDIVDGSSYTIAIAESLMGTGVDQSSIRSVDRAKKFVVDGGSDDLRAFQALRDAAMQTDAEDFISRQTSWFGSRGGSWSFGFFGAGGVVQGWYTPNHTLPDLTTCAMRVSGARSNHDGGVVIGRADGSVDFISDSIDLKTYRAMWTIDGGEVGAETVSVAP